MPSNKQIWLTFNNGKEKLQLPVNPSQFEIGNGSQTEKIQVIGLGEVSRINDPVLKSFSFESQFPANYSPICEYRDIPDPRSAAALISKWKASGNPMRMIVTNTPWNFAVTVEDFTYREEGGDVDTIYYSLTLQEYKFVKVRKIDEKKDKAGNKTAKVKPTSARPAANNKSNAKTYKVVKNDSLYKIGKKFGIRWDVLADINNIKAPYSLKVGQVIKLK